jgi:hypothetical protein
MQLAPRQSANVHGSPAMYTTSSRSSASSTARRCRAAASRGSRSRCGRAGRRRPVRAGSPRSGVARQRRAGPGSGVAGRARRLIDARALGAELRARCRVDLPAPGAAVGEQSGGESCPRSARDFSPCTRSWRAHAREVLISSTAVTNPIPDIGRIIAEGGHAWPRPRAPSWSGS